MIIFPRVKLEDTDNLNACAILREEDVIGRMEFDESQGIVEFTDGKHLWVLQVLDFENDEHGTIRVTDDENNTWFFTDLD